MHAIRHYAASSLEDMLSELSRSFPSLIGTAVSSYGLSCIFSRLTKSVLESTLPEGEALSVFLPLATLSPVPRTIAYPCLVYLVRLLGQSLG